MWLGILIGMAISLVLFFMFLKIFMSFIYDVIAVVPHTSHMNRIKEFFHKRYVNMHKKYPYTLEALRSQDYSKMFKK